jgi:hypothetical protein
VSLVFTYLFLLVVMLIGAAALGARVRKFILGFTLVFWINYVWRLLAPYAYIAATASWASFARRAGKSPAGKFPQPKRLNLIFGVPLRPIDEISYGGFGRAQLGQDPAGY